MRRLVRFLGTTLLGGLLVILPIYLAVLATLAIGKKLIGILAPLAKLLPEGVPHPDVVVALLTVLACFVAGLVAAGFPRTSVGRGFEEKVLERLPGYSMLRMATRSLFGDAKAGLQIALVEMEDGLVVGVIVERHGRFFGVLASLAKILQNSLAGRGYSFARWRWLIGAIQRFGFALDARLPPAEGILGNHTTGFGIVAVKEACWAPLSINQARPCPQQLST